MNQLCKPLWAECVSLKWQRLSSYAVKFHAYRCISGEASMRTGGGWEKIVCDGGEQSAGSPRHMGKGTVPQESRSGRGLRGDTSLHSQGHRAERWKSGLGEREGKTFKGPRLLITSPENLKEPCYTPLFFGPRPRTSQLRPALLHLPVQLRHNACVISIPGC